ncbi:hypothetical protein EON64_06765 [archaeon]|nr:MAG: hypothetical protein EON64_06765 [archaeon]
MDVEIRNYQGKVISRLDPARLSFSLRDPEDVLTLLCILFIIVATDETYITLLQKSILVLLVYLFCLVREDFSYFQAHHVRRSAHNVSPIMTVPFPSKLSHLTFTIPNVKVLRDEVLGQQKISVASLASRLLLHVHMESSQGGAWEVWTCYEDFYLAYLELTKTHSSVNVPMLVDFMQVLIYCLCLRHATALYIHHIYKNMSSLHDS